MSPYLFQQLQTLPMFVFSYYAILAISREHFLCVYCLFGWHEHWCSCWCRPFCVGAFVSPLLLHLPQKAGWCTCPSQSTVGHWSCCRAPHSCWPYAWHADATPPLGPQGCPGAGYLRGRKNRTHTHTFKTETFSFAVIESLCCRSKSCQNNNIKKNFLSLF